MFMLLASLSSISGASDYTLPKWLESRIQILQPSWVARFTYNKQTAYLIAYPCCEEGSPVFDASGRQLCVLSAWDWNSAKGCPEFDKIATNEQIVWGDKGESE